MKLFDIVPINGRKFCIGFTELSFHPQKKKWSCGWAQKFINLGGGALKPFWRNFQLRIPQGEDELHPINLTKKIRICFEPIGSMYGIYNTYIWLIFMANVYSKYTIPMDPMGNAVGNHQQVNELPILFDWRHFFVVSSTAPPRGFRGKQKVPEMLQVPLLELLGWGSFFRKEKERWKEKKCWAKKMAHVIHVWYIYLYI